SIRSGVGSDIGCAGIPFLKVYVAAKWLVAATSWCAAPSPVPSASTRQQLAGALAHRSFYCFA
ncbi:MAG TPA: hypothetical protein VMW62_03950, partial [Chloroflexota bacterium]|nr:hypothetical protein [Chloroflexota bacterium]